MQFSEFLRFSKKVHITALKKHQSKFIWHLPTLTNYDIIYFTKEENETFFKFTLKMVQFKKKHEIFITYLDCGNYHNFFNPSLNS